jgi:peptidoglycan/xylan/chitin deacetylase (PgdA/CDA1 family)
LFSHISMNWRGRPLTSHEVIVNSIAATTTRTGLRVEAVLDTGTPPTGTKVSDAGVDALPMSRHRFHGDWNYTLHPTHPHRTAGSAGVTDPVPAADRIGTAALRHPDLTGMTRQQLQALIRELIPALAEAREQSLRAQRGGERRRAPGAGATPKLSPADRILATVLYLRKLGTQELLGQLFEVDRKTITDAIGLVRPLLERHGHHIAA